MLVLFKSKTERNPLTYNGFTFNQQIGSSQKDIVEVNSVVPQTVIQSHAEADDFATGLEPYGAYKRAKRLVLRGVIRASTDAKLYAYIEQAAAAFDPDEANRQNPDTFGFLPLDFDVPTEDLTNFPTGLMPCRYYVRAEQAFEPPISQYNGLDTPFVLPLLAADPRRYLQAASSRTGAGLADNSLATVWSWPTLTIAMTGVGNAAFEIENVESSASLVLDLSGTINGDSITVDMQRREIKKNGVYTPSLFVSGDYFHMEPGVSTINVTNGTNASPTLVWRSAFSY